MRLHFTLSPNRKTVPFAYQHRLTGVFHKWLGDNNLHDKISLYSLSWLAGSRRSGSGLEFSDGATWFVSFFEEEFAERLVNGALQDPQIFCGMYIDKIEQQLTPAFGTKYNFRTASPIFVKGKQTGNGQPPHHYLYNESETDELMTKTLIHKMDVANQNAGREIFDAVDKQVKIAFDRDFPHPRTKLVQIKNIGHKTSVCPVIIEGTEKALQFAWNVGVGNGTGSCFGSLKEN